MKSILVTFLLTSLIPLCAQTAPAGDEPAVPKKNPVEFHFERARDLFDQGKMVEAGDEIFRATDRIHHRMIDAEATPTAPVVNASNSLEALATRVSEGKVKDGATLNRTFAKVSKVMGTYYASVAQEKSKSDPLLAGTALDRTAGYIEGTAKWSGQKLAKTSKEIIAGIRKAGQALSNPNQANPNPTPLLTKGSEILGRLGPDATHKPVKPKNKKVTGTSKIRPSR